LYKDIKINLVFYLHVLESGGKRQQQVVTELSLECS